MGNFAEIFLGILTSVGGFVEVGELTFTLAAGSLFGYTLLWVTVVGTIGIIVYCEMAGRIAAVRHRAVFHLIRERTGFAAGLSTLVAATIVNVLTCAAETGGVALLWQLLVNWPYRWLLLVALIVFLLVVWTLEFKWIERVFGLGGLLMIVFVIAGWRGDPDWHAVAAGLVPRLRADGTMRDTLQYAYYAVAILSSIMLPYETYFYASGAIEDRWTAKDVPLNRLIVVVGFALGSVLGMGLMVLGATFFAPRSIEPELPGTAALAVAATVGTWGAIAALLGMFFAFGGAAIETALSGAYDIAQFLGWPWGKHKRPAEAARFTLGWIAVFAGGALIVLTGLDPVAVVEYTIVFSVVVLPFTYFPVLSVAADKRIMGEHANGIIANAFGWFYLVAITLAAVLAIPLFLYTHGGRA